MPNWCSNSIIIRPRTKNDMGELLRLFVTWSMATSKYKKSKVESSWRDNWIGNLYLEQGYTEETIEHFVCRGSINDLSIEEPEKIGRSKRFEEEKWILLNCDSAWSPCAEDIRKAIVEKFYKGLQLEYVAEEQGVGIFINSDSSGEIYKEKYFISYEFGDFGDTHYIEDTKKGLEELKDVVKKLSGIDIDSFEDFEGNINKIQEEFRKNCGGDDGYLTIEPYTKE